MSNVTTEYTTHRGWKPCPLLNLNKSRSLEWWPIYRKDFTAITQSSATSNGLWKTKRKSSPSDWNRYLCLTLLLDRDLYGLGGIRLGTWLVFPSHLVNVEIHHSFNIRKPWTSSTYHIAQHRSVQRKPNSWWMNGLTFESKTTIYHFLQIININD